MLDFIIFIKKEIEVYSLSKLFIKKPQIKLSYINDTFEFLAWGDPICKDSFKKQLLKKPTVDYIINNLFGHYYYLLLNKTDNTICIGNSLFSILPVYFAETKNSLCFSNDPFSVKDNSEPNKYNKRFLLENILFNYPLFNQSCIEGVNLLAANNFIQITKGGLRQNKHTDITQYFSESPTPWRKAVDEISDLFIDCTTKYFPEEGCATSLTGGFDGRTLVACGLHQKKKIQTYSFGSSESEDIKIAESLSSKAGLEFIMISLDHNYLSNYYKQAGLDFINTCNGNASFARAHYLYATKFCSKKTSYILTGNFGSEVFRTTHSTGVVANQNLINLFNSKNYKSSIEELECSKEWNWLNRWEFKHEWESLKEELKTLPRFDPLLKGLTRNQQYYKTVFEEVFRKYFGSEIVNQFSFLSNRTPFLDFDFLKGVLRTGLAGVHSDFYTNNPFKRFKGQVLYAHIIRKTFHAFGAEMTDKGYKPEDLLNLSGNIKVAGSFLQKKLNNRFKLDYDPYAVNDGFSMHKNYWLDLIADPILFNQTKLKEDIMKMPSYRDSLIIALSQAYFHNLKF